MAEHEEVTVTKRTITCRHCGSADVSKYGVFGGIQYYTCKSCHKKFVGREGYPRYRYSKDIIALTLTYYYNGMSYRGIAQTLQDTLKVTIPRRTLWAWVTKFSLHANRYALTLKPKLSDTWIADETAIGIWGEQYWFWDIIDMSTRFLIASHLSRTRTERDALALFQMAKERSKTMPRLIITDKLGQYNRAFNKTFYSYHPAKSAMHLQSRGMTSPVNINLIERFHGTLKQRTKIMRDLKEKHSARIILDGFVTHYNFFLEHGYLKGKTPSQVTGISEGIHGWHDLIELAMKLPYSNPNIAYDWEKRFEVR